MNFGFTQEQEILRDTVKRFLQAECSSEFVRRMMADDSAHSDSLWRNLARQGWLGILVPESLEGSAGGFLDLAVILEEMGRVLVPGAFFSTVVLGETAVLAAGSRAQQEELLPELSRGNLLLTVALAEANGRVDPDSVRMRARKRGATFTLSGEKFFVPDAHIADRLVVVARTKTTSDPTDGMTLFLVDRGAPGVTVTQMKTVDMTRRQCHVRFDDVTVDGTAVLGAVHRGWPVVRRVLDRATAGLCIEMVGTAQQVLDMSIEYAKERTQFGRPIGSFQAVKHKCVDMMVAVENARALAYFAAWAVSESAPEAVQAVPMAKAYCSDVTMDVCSEAIQVHGGIGYTWEHDLHLFYRRALTSEASFGTASVHREAVAQQLVR